MARDILENQIQQIDMAAGILKKETNHIINLAAGILKRGFHKINILRFTPAKEQDKKKWQAWKTQKTIPQKNKTQKKGKSSVLSKET